MRMIVRSPAFVITSAIRAFAIALFVVGDAFRAI